MAASRASGRDSWRCWASPHAACSRFRLSRERSRTGCSMLASSLVLAIAIYAVGVTRLWRRAGYGRGVRPFEALAYTAGCAALVIALSPPLDEWSERWLAAHMVQHELLMVVAAQIIAVGAPLVGMLWAIPVPPRHAIIRFVQHTPLPTIFLTTTAPPVAFIFPSTALFLSII